MARASGLAAVWLAYFSQPASDRILFRTIRKRKVRQIVEIGVGDGQRALRMISLAQRYHAEAEVRYAGFDLFETRGAADGPGLSLKEAHRLLSGTKARIQLVPGEFQQALVRVANSLSGNDLLLISTGRPLDSLGRGWFFIPRMLAPQAMIFAAEPAQAGITWRSIATAELGTLAATPRRRAA